MYDAKITESEIIELWKKNNIPDKVLRVNTGKKKLYLMDGPPYASGEIHMGTALNKVLKDFYARAYRMMGYDVWAQPGYDTHGLPIEHQVEKKLGINNKKEIESFGVGKFVEECRKFATEFIDVMNQQFENLGVWMWWKEPYLTLDTNYIESTWHTFKVGYDKGLLYRDVYAVHVCPRCETAVAYNEIEYKEVIDESVYVKFKLKGNEYLLIFTTTPWTLPSNTGVMINPKADYAKLKVGKDVLIIAKNLVETVMRKAKLDDYKILETVHGNKLVGLTYDSPLPELPLQHKIKGRIVASEQYVSLDEGTGLVHTAPGHGEDDFRVGKENNLPILSPLNMNGTFKEEAGFLKGKFAKSADPEIIKNLEEKGLIFAKEKIKHDYPFCWRCKTPLLFMAVPQWFFKVTDIRNKIIKENNKVNWVPNWAGKRFENWLQSLGDWPISRQRYWGIPLPIWTCNHCGNVKVFGSSSELPKKPKDLHRPSIDEIVWTCKKCGKGEMRRIPDVLDVWFDSGVASWASLNYPSDKKLFKKLWPADINIEGPDQIRGWWNSQMISSVITFDRRPFERILMHGFILDARGNKMSKSVGNVVSPHAVIDKFGRDVLRYFLLRNDPSNDFNFDWEATKDVMRFFNVLYNSFVFYKTYCKPAKLTNLKPEDKWIISRTNSVLNEYRGLIKGLQGFKALQVLEKFVLEDISHWYIKLIRDRTWPNYKGKDKAAAFATMQYIMEQTITMLASAAPFLAEKLYIEMNGKPSVHLTLLPEVETKLIKADLENNMEIAKEVVEIVNAIRHEHNIKSRYVLNEVTIEHHGKTVDVVKNFSDVIKRQANVKKVKLGKGKGTHKSFGGGNVWLDTTITEELKGEWLLSELMRAVQEKRKDLKLKVENKITLYIVDKNVFSKWKEEIENSTGSKVVFGKACGERGSVEFEDKEYEFGVKI